MTSDVLSLEWTIDDEEATFDSDFDPDVRPTFLISDKFASEKNAEIVPASSPSPFERFIDDER